MIWCDSSGAIVLHVPEPVGECGAVFLQVAGLVAKRMVSMRTSPTVLVTRCAISGWVASSGPQAIEKPTAKLGEIYKRATGSSCLSRSIPTKRCIPTNQSLSEKERSLLTLCSMEPKGKSGQSAARAYARVRASRI